MRLLSCTTLIWRSNKVGKPQNYLAKQKRKPIWAISTWSWLKYQIKLAQRAQLAVCFNKYKISTRFWNEQPQHLNQVETGVFS